MNTYYLAIETLILAFMALTIVSVTIAGVLTLIACDSEMRDFDTSNNEFERDDASTDVPSDGDRVRGHRCRLDADQMGAV